MKLVPRRIISIYITLIVFGTTAYSSASTIAGHIKIDNFGYRTGDYKIAYFTANPGATVGIYNASTSVLAYSVPTADITSQGTDTTGITGDTVWWANFSAFTTPGTYYVYSSALTEQSYNFQINDCIYQAPMTATLKALYYQRCGCAKPAQYAGANWSDAATCHLQDETCGPAPGCTYPNTYGTLNLAGGWHDAGDFNKYIGSTPSGSCNSWGGDSGEAIHDLMLAYEWNPSLFSSLSSNIPESGNGNPDILNEAKWELDWYLKMQMTDKHVLSVVHATGGGGASPPSTDTQTRYYYPPNGDGEAQFVAMLSNSARIMSSVPGLASYATTLRSAAEATWNAYETTWTADDLKFWAAAEIFRMEESLGGPASVESAAQSFVDNYIAIINPTVTPPPTWNGFWLNEDKFQQNWGILAYIESTNATPAVVSEMKADWSTLMNDLFSQTDSYNSAMHSWDYFWGADEVKMNYAMELLWAAKIGATGGQSVTQCVQHAEDFLHYMNGANTLNMTLMTNSNAIGASHGIWRIYHQWFGNYNPTNGPGTYSYDNFIGKPVSVIDPLYPYYAGTDNYGISDSGPSSFGPPPGIVPDGPSNGYATNNPPGQSMPPMLTGEAAPPYEKGYRDWDWVDPNGNKSQPWIVNETGLYYTASYMIVASAFTTICSNSTPTPTATPTSTPTVTLTATPTPTSRITATRTSTVTPTNTPTYSTTATPTSTPTVTATRTSTVTPTNSPTFSATVTPTSTFTVTPTQTPLNTYTPSNTPTITDTPTQTLSPTFTLSPTSTATTTPTLTPTNTPTVTSTFTQTNTPTISNTPTSTLSPTSTSTVTPTLTPTDSPTVTSTFTTTHTSTITHTFTNTLSPTYTSTVTPTLTPTMTPTLTLTGTPTYTPTVTFTSTNTLSPTFTFTPSITSTPTPTFTWTLTPSWTSTSTWTMTPTQTSTGTPSSTLTPTPTSAVITGSGSPVTLSVVSGTSNVVAFQENLNNPAGTPVTLTNLVLNDTGTGNPSSGISEAVAYLNGIQVGSPAAFSGTQVVLNLGNAVITNGANLQIQVSFTNTATGSFQMSVTSITGSSGNNGGQPVSFSGLPETGNSIIVSQPTPTFTVSLTPTWTGTPTATLPPTWTPTITLTPPTSPSLFPNPVTGETVSLYEPYGGDVQVEVFTLAFRKVMSQPLGHQLPGIVVTLKLRDESGGELSDGLYYVVVKSQGNRWVGKLLVLR